MPGPYDFIAQHAQQTRIRKNFPFYNEGFLGGARQTFGQELPGLLAGLKSGMGQNTFLTPEQMSNLMRQLTSPAIDTLSQQYGQQSRGLAQNFANRGQLFGGSLTGAQAQLGGQHQQALSNLFSNVGGQLGQLDLNLGAQRQGQSTQLLQALLSQILGGQYGLAGVQMPQQRNGFMDVLGGLVGMATPFIPKPKGASGA